MKSKVIIIGATGGVGSYLLDYLFGHMGDDFDLVACGRRDTDFFDRYGIRYCKLDMSCADDFSRLPQNDVHAVVLLGGLLPAGMEGYSPQDYIKVNSMGALNVLEYCKKVQADRILYTQTISDVLGGVSAEHPVIAPDAPRNIIMSGDHAVYALSKCLAVDLIEHYRQQYGLKGFVFRLPTIYLYKPNPYWHVDGQKRMMGYRLIMDRASRGEPLEIWGDPTRAKDVVYVKDLCQMFAKAIVCDAQGGIFNVGTGVGVTTEEQIRGIAKVFCPAGCESEISYHPEKPSGPSYIMDVSNARDVLGYRPLFGYLDYLEDFKREQELNRFADLY